MKGHRPVLWSQGLFLHPQHFQAADQSFTEQVDTLRSYGLPYFWGVNRMVFSEQSHTHSIRLENFEAIFPSGAAINVPYDSSLAPIPLGSDWPLPDKIGTLYVGLALPNASGANATLMTSQADTVTGTRFTYSENGENTPDMYGDSAATPVQKLQYAPVLIRDIDLERYADYECIPVAMLRRVGEHIERDASFLPPLLNVGGHAHLSALLQEVHDTALSCASRLVGYKSAVSTDTPDMRFVLNFTALNILNRYIPALAHLQSMTTTHPWHVYGLLRVFIGELSSFFDDMDCLGRTTAHSDGIPQYTHDDLNTCFPFICQMLMKLMNNLGIEESRVLPLLLDAPYFSATIPQDFITPSSKFWLTIRTGEMSETMAEHFPRLVKVGAKDRLNLITSKAVSGISLQRKPAPPGFLRRADSAWYILDTAHVLWQSIIEQEKISVFWEGAPHDAEVKLVATRR